MIQVIIKTNAFLAERHLQQQLKQYVSSKAQDFNFNKFSCKDVKVDAIISVLKTPPMMAPTRTVVIENFDELSSADAQSLLEVLKTTPDSTNVFLIASKLDKRTAFSKELTKFAKLFEFKELYPNEIPAFLVVEAQNLGLKLKKDLAQVLVDFAGTSLTILVNELEKLQLFMMPRVEVTLQDIEDIVAQGVGQNIFLMSSLMAQKKYQQVYQLYLRLIEEGESLIKILSLIVTHFRKLLLTKELKNEGQTVLAQKLAVPAFFVKDYLQQSSGFSLTELKTIFGELMTLSENVRHSSISQHVLFCDFLQKVCLR